MTEQLANFGETTLAEALDDSETTWTVTDGSVFPSSGNFRVVVDDEIGLVTARSTNDLTVTRGAEGTTAAAHDNGADIKMVLTEGSLKALLIDELDYAEVTSNASITATSEGTADTVISASAVTFDGSTVSLIEFYAYSAAPAFDAAGRVLRFWLYDGSSSIGQIGVMIGAAAADDRKPVLVRRRLTPSAASHTYSIRCSVSAGTAVVYAGPGVGGDSMPMYIRIVNVPDFT